LLLRILNDALTLLSLYVKYLSLYAEPSNTQLVVRLSQQGVFNFKFPDQLSFYEESKRQTGQMSFINHAKGISELIPFEWTTLTKPKLKMKMKEAIPLFVNHWSTDSDLSNINSKDLMQMNGKHYYINYIHAEYALWIIQ